MKLLVDILVLQLPPTTSWFIWIPSASNLFTDPGHLIEVVDDMESRNIVTLAGILSCSSTMF